MRRRFFLSPNSEAGAPPTESPAVETPTEPPKTETPKPDENSDDEREPKWFKPYRKTLRRIESDYLTRRGQEATAEPPTEPVTVVVQEKETPEPPKNEKPETPQPTETPTPKPMGGTMLRRNRSAR